MRLRLFAAAFAVLCLASPGRAGLALKSCHVDGTKEVLLCGTFVVPENRAIEGARTLPLEVVVVPAKNKPAKEPIFFLAGGPGQAATGNAAGFATEWTRQDHDVVLMDMRGTGKGNRLDCHVGGSDANPQEYIEPLFLDGARYGACAKALSKTADLTQYTTTEAMRDLEDLRRALGYGKIDLIGGSYGTRAGMVYMHLFPGSVRAAVLSGLDPMADRSPLYHARAAQGAFDTLAAQCAADAVCHKAFPDPKGDLDAVLATLRKAPARVTAKNPATGKPIQVRLTASAFGDGLRVMLYDEEMGRRVPLLLKKARAGDYGPFADIALDHGRGMAQDIAMGLLLSVTCTEDVSRIRPEEVAKETAGSFIGDFRVRGQMAACSTWPKGVLPKDYSGPFRVNVPALLVSGNLDPVTPAHWGAETQRYFPNSLHVVVPGAHVSGGPCVEAIIKRFIATADVKSLDTSCIATEKLPPFALPK
jgi:pimeloyl-ACP methyl ester carboxylesterase